MNVLRIGDLFAGTAERPAAEILSTVMFVVLVVYLVLGIRSFAMARRARGAPRPRLRCLRRALQIEETARGRRTQREDAESEGRDRC